MRTALLGFLTLALGVDGWAAARDPAMFEPATFRTDEYSLAHQIAFPFDHRRGEDFSLSLACTVQVTRRGWLKDPFCLGVDAGTKDFERRVLSATRRARATPARYKGKRTPVAMKFTAIFVREDGEAFVTVVPNQYLNTNRFGARYSAPQLLQRQRTGYLATCRQMNLILRITVDADGRAANARFYAGDKAARGCIEPAKKHVAQLRYVPGTVDGKPTEMDHLYLVSWRAGTAATRGEVVFRGE